MTQQDPFGQLDVNHWLLRLIAFVIDCIIIGIPTAIIMVLFNLSSGWYLPVLTPLIFGLLEVLYFTFMDMSSGATIGKRLMGFRVQTTRGDRLNFNNAFLRNISKIYWLLLLLDWLLGVLTMGNDKRQKYSDRLAETTVVSVGQPFTSQSPAYQSTPTPNYRSLSRA